MQKLLYSLLSLSLLIFSCQNKNSQEPIDLAEEPASQSGEIASDVRIEAEELFYNRPKLEMSATEASISQRNNEFALNFFKKLNEEGSNSLYSPLSLSLALGMTYAGAGGQTAKEMAQVFQFKENSLDFHQEYNQLVSKLTEPYGEGTEIKIANRIYVQQGKELQVPFLEILDKAYQAPIQEVNFAQTEAVKKEINTWVSDQTKGNIPELLDKVPQNAKMALVNAIYFYGSWATSFKKELTASADFFPASGAAIPTDFMQHDFTAGDVLGPGYTESDRFQALALPYKGGKTSMMILLPKEGISIDELLSDFSATTFGESIYDMRNSKPKVHLELPKWKLKEMVPAQKILEAMGMQQAFQQGVADFSGMDGVLDLYISKLVHKATIEVNEEGTEATAATVVVMSGRSAGNMSRPVNFIANRPFLYFIVDNDSYNILFMGKYAKPENTTIQ